MDGLQRFASDYLSRHAGALEEADARDEAANVFYRGPTGVTIDAKALVAELEGCDLILKVERGGGVPDPWSTESPLTTEDAPCTAEVLKIDRPGRGLVLDSEAFPLRERVEGVARLLRRVLPEPAKAISHMSDEQWQDFQGAKADA